MKKHPYLIAAPLVVRARTQHHLKAWLAAAAVSVLSAAPSVAGIYVSTLENTPDPGGAAIGIGNWFGMSFSTDDQAYYLGQIQVAVNLPSPLAPTWTLDGLLYAADGGGIPTSLLAGATFTHNTLEIGQQIVTFTLTAPFELAANTFYSFVVATEEPLVAGVWGLTSSATGFSTDVPESSWQMPALLVHSGNNGLTWTDLGGGAYRLIGQVSAEPVPEPSTFALLGGAALLGVFARRKLC